MYIVGREMEEDMYVESIVINDVYTKVSKKSKAQLLMRLETLKVSSFG